LNTTNIVKTIILLSFSHFLNFKLENAFAEIEEKSEGIRGEVVYSKSLPLIHKAFELISDNKNLPYFAEDVGLLLAIEKLRKLNLNSDLQSKILNRLDNLKENRNGEEEALSFDGIEIDNLDNKNYENSSDLIMPSISIHAFKIDVVNPVDDVTGDNIYGFFFVTDGHIPTGRVTSIYKGLRGGGSFYLNQIDRLVYPILANQYTSIPKGKIIIDYGLVESDTADIEGLQSLTEAIMELAILAYGPIELMSPKIIKLLRSEVKLLTKALLNLENDDRVVMNTKFLDIEDFHEIFKDGPYKEITENYKGKHLLSKWEYNLHFRYFKKM
jgi:hypothetical protein